MKAAADTIAYLGVFGRWIRNKEGRSASGVDYSANSSRLKPWIHA